MSFDLEDTPEDDRLTGGQKKELTYEDRYAKIIKQRSGNQFRMKKSDFMVYMKRHPTYSISSGSQGGLDTSRGFNVMK